MIGIFSLFVPLLSMLMLELLLSLLILDLSLSILTLDFTSVKPTSKSYQGKLKEETLKCTGCHSLASHSNMSYFPNLGCFFFLTDTNFYCDESSCKTKELLPHSQKMDAVK